MERLINDFPNGSFVVHPIHYKQAVSYGYKVYSNPLFRINDIIITDDQQAMQTSAYCTEQWLKLNSLFDGRDNSPTEQVSE